MTMVIEKVCAETLVAGEQGFQQLFFSLKSLQALRALFSYIMTAGSLIGITKINLTHCHPFPIHVTCGLGAFCLTVVLHHYFIILFAT